MAYIVTVNRKLIPVTPEQGNKLWLLSNGELEPTAAEKEKLSRIDRIILNSKNPSTPLSYLAVHAPVEEVGSYAAVLGKRV